MSNVTIISNGHGEDVIGASVAASLRSLAPELELRAFPLVDEGAAYLPLAIERLGPCRRMPSGGFTMHSLPYFLADLRAGFAGMTVAQIAALARVRSDVLLVVGDIYAQMLASLAGARFRAVLQPLVSVLHRGGPALSHVNRFFMERISYPERALMRHRIDVVYTRDEATAAWLRACGVPQALALGNPMVDRATGRPLEGLHGGTVIALLPGTRAHTSAALERMVAALALVPDVTGVVAWSGGALPRLPGWEEDRSVPAVAGRVLALRRETSRLWVLEGRFGDVLASARVALGTAGTANEQAAARGVPVVSFAVPPHFTRAYLANQKRLLGDALTVTTTEPAAIAAALGRLLADELLWGRAARAGGVRMGAPGGSDAIARDLLGRAGLAPAAGPWGEGERSGCAG